MELYTLIGAHNSDLGALRSKLCSEIIGENPEFGSNDCTIDLCKKLNHYMNDTKPADKDLTKTWVSFHRRCYVSNILFLVNKLHKFFGLDIQAENNGGRDPSNEGMDLCHCNLPRCQDPLEIIKRLIEVTIQDIEKDYDIARWTVLSSFFPRQEEVKSARY